jgi:hypothetical protein
MERGRVGSGTGTGQSTRTRLEELKRKRPMAR